MRTVKTVVDTEEQFIQYLIRHEMLLQFQYPSSKTGNLKLRRVKPKEIVGDNLFSSDLDKGEPRTYKISKMKNLDVSSIRFMTDFI